MNVAVSIERSGRPGAVVTIDTGGTSHLSIACAKRLLADLAAVVATHERARALDRPLNLDRALHVADQVDAEVASWSVRAPLAGSQPVGE